MFDIGWSEIVVVAVVAILVVGPKDLPAMLRTFGKTVTGFRRMAADFQRQFDQALRETELDSLKNDMKAPFKPLDDARKAAQDFQKQVNDSIGDVSKDPAPSGAAIAKPATGPATGVAEGPAEIASQASGDSAAPDADEASRPVPAVVDEAPADIPEAAGPVDEASSAGDGTQKPSSGTPA